MLRSVTLLLLLTPVAAPRADEPASAAAWKFDQIHLKNGRTCRGLIVRETPTLTYFQYIRQRPGRPTGVFSTTFTPGEIEAIERLNDEDRKILKARIQALADAPSEKERMGRIALKPCDWNGKANAGLQYQSDCFVLTSNASEVIVRQASARLEQVYMAYSRYLPPQVLQASPTTIELYRSKAEYAARMRAQGRPFLNAAFYDPAANKIVCASELAEIGDRLESARVSLQARRADLDQRENVFKRLYRGAERDRLMAGIREARAEYDKVDRLTDTTFDQATKQFFAVLYHEAFHAYLAAFTETTGQPAMPRWLNEGLAQIFETALIEAGEMRIGHADERRLKLIRELIRKGEFVPVGRLLAAAAPQFAAAHATDRAASDANYLAAWAVAFHLTFDRRAIGSPAFSEYLRALADKANPVSAFEKLVGQSLPDYEKALDSYLARLQPDGTVSPIRPDN